LHFLGQVGSDDGPPGSRYNPAMLESVAPGIWCRSVPLRFFGLETGTRMTLVRLSDGRLLVHSPVPLAPGLKAEVDALGAVAGIVAPSLFHHLYVAPWAAAYPQAITACCPGLEQKRRDLPWQRILGDTPEAEWRGDVEQVFFRANTLANEVVLFHRASGTLVCSDTIFNLARHPSPLTRAAAVLLGNRAPGATLLERLMIRDRAGARAQIDRMLAWKPERIVLAHGEIVASDGTDVLRRAFAWL
jgi:hypothetical protein